MSKRSHFFSNNLITWYLENSRALPWRETKDPYRIWLSEIILQQTRVAQGLPYYEEFLKAFPSVFDLAKASEEQVLKLWQGLGYYSRARNLHFTAKYIVNEYQGVFPNTYKELLNLKGVGDYTASAIASICFNESAAVVDGNVYRVLSRFFGIDTPINTTQGIKQFKSLAQELIPSEDPGTYNQALMEFGARYCIPSSPDCGHCIFETQCEAFNKKRVGELPVKLKKTKVKKHFYNFLVFLSEDGKTLMEKREGKGIWQNLYQFPLIESHEKLTVTSLKEHKAFQDVLKNIQVTTVASFNDVPIIHKLSHKHLFATFWILETESLPTNAIPFQKVDTFPVPVLIENFISSFGPFQQ
ncbi:MAG: A/G-specific adenine glycosylase [Alteromonas sp.]|nr:A/G-specific adenine glycosylase [Alteromonas sp.]MAY22640.1 A/G-specific adenine glycosylase [Flavobacteriaceae bacterium]|tara:strand:+ start:83042 stop:84109 length:1068 start_codon:yes stop_codon:yes gene_type:complete